MVSSSIFFFSNFFILYLIFDLATTITSTTTDTSHMIKQKQPQPTQCVETVIAAAVAARDVSCLELLVCFIILLLH